MQEIIFTKVLFDAAFFSSLITFVMFLLGRYVYEFKKTELIVTSLFTFSSVSSIIICCSYISGFGMIVWLLFLIAALMLG